MSVSDILDVFGSYKKLTSTNDEDWVDRLNHVYTVSLLVVFAIFIAGGQYVGDPIECLKPHAIDIEMGYVNTNCWIKNTYYVGHDETSIPQDPEDRKSRELTYYQWVPQILILMAFFFKLPAVVWNIFNSASGMNMDKIVTMTDETQIGDEKQREETVGMISKYLDRWLMSHRYCQRKMSGLNRIKQSAHLCLCYLFSKREGTFLIGLYMLMKFLYVINVICQFFLLNKFMGDWFSTIGFKLSGLLSVDKDAAESRVFPLVTFCNFKIRQFGQNVNDVDVQCVLPINLFNQRVFIFIWYWLVVVSVCSILNFLFWVWRCFITKNRVDYIKKYLKMIQQIFTEEDRGLLREFTQRYLKDDGVFVMRIIARNTNDILLADILRHMWTIFKKRKTDREALRGGEEREGKEREALRGAKEREALRGGNDGEKPVEYHRDGMYPVLINVHN